MKTIFIIDDDPAYLKLMTGKLNMLSYITESFENVLDALPRLKHKPDVIFLDHHYANSVSKGHEFIELIRLHTNETSIVYFSADPKEKLFNEIIRHRADAFLRKDEQLFDIIPGFLEGLFEQRKRRGSLWNRIIFWVSQNTSKRKKG